MKKIFFVFFILLTIRFTQTTQVQFIDHQISGRVSSVLQTINIAQIN